MGAPVFLKDQEYLSVSAIIHVIIRVSSLLYVSNWSRTRSWRDTGRTVVSSPFIIPTSQVVTISVWEQEVKEWDKELSTAPESQRIHTGDATFHVVLRCLSLGVSRLWSKRKRKDLASLERPFILALSQIIGQSRSGCFSSAGNKTRCKAGGTGAFFWDSVF